MTDITKCKNDKCPKKERCYRWTATDGMRQSVSMFNKELKEECEYFWKVSGVQKLKKTKEQNNEVEQI